MSNEKYSKTTRKKTRNASLENLDVIFSFTEYDCDSVFENDFIAFLTIRKEARAKTTIIATGGAIAALPIDGSRNTVSSVKYVRVNMLIKRKSRAIIDL
jgi:hypothetical protein